MFTDPKHESLPAVWVWGLPLAPLTFEQTLDKVEELIQSGSPHYFITANLHYAMLTDRDRRLRQVNFGAAFLMPCPGSQAGRGPVRGFSLVRTAAVPVESTASSCALHFTKRLVVSPLIYFVNGPGFVARPARQAPEPDRDLWVPARLSLARRPR